VTTTETFDPAKVEEFAGRLMPILAGGLLSHMIDVGDRTGLFIAAAQGPGTSDEIAQRAGLHERYVREWLSAMATSGIVTFDAATQTFALPPEHAAMLVGTTSMAPFAALNTMLAKFVPDIARVFREGGGVPYADYCPDFTGAMDAMGRGQYDQFLVDAYLPLVPELVERLRAGADVADVACGAGHALVVLARAFPASTFTGYDLDDYGLERARQEAADAGLTNVRYEHADIATHTFAPSHDAVLMFDALHDQVDPPRVLRQVRAALKPDGIFFLKEPHAGNSLAEDIENPMSSILYSVSTMHCLTVSLAHGGAGIGTAFREEHARELLVDAGFEDPTVHAAPGDPMDAIYVTRPH
jgi:SAM-dependent methyltransferase